MSPPLLLSSENILETPRWWARRGRYRFEHGEERTYYSIIHRPGAVMIPFDGERFLLVEQYRVNIERLSLEFPMGGVEEGEDPETGARRELLEETGIEGKQWAFLGKIANANGSQQHWLHLFSVTGLSRPQDATPELDEIGMRSIWATDSEITQWIREGRIHDAKTLASWSCYQALSSQKI